MRNNSKLLTAVILTSMLAGCGISHNKYNVYFKPGSSELTKESKATLQMAAAKLNKYKFGTAKIYGYTDTTGSYEHNVKLAQKRVSAVDSMLVTLGAEEKDIIVKSTNHEIGAMGTKGNANLRRVDITISKW